MCFCEYHVGYIFPNIVLHFMLVKSTQKSSSANPPEESARYAEIDVYEEIEQITDNIAFSTSSALQSLKLAVTRLAMNKVK